MLNWDVFGKISLWISWIYLNFTALWLREILEAQRSRVVTVVFHFPGAVSYCHRKLKSRVCSVLKYYYNSPHILHCKVQSDSPRWKTFVRPKMGCVRAKIGLTGQLDRRQPGNYLKLCNCWLRYSGISFKLVNQLSKVSRWKWSVEYVIHVTKSQSIWNLKRRASEFCIALHVSPLMGPFISGTISRWLPFSKTTDLNMFIQQ